MAREFSITPRGVPLVDTSFRKIATMFPVPESVPILEKLYALEPIAMRGQPHVIWDRAEGLQVYDAWGNQWLDWSSGVLITNAGHGRQEIVDAIIRQASSKLLTNYCFPSEIRMRMVDKLSSILPEPLKKVFLLTTGSETVECAIKLCRTYGAKAGARGKNVIVSFDKAFTVERSVLNRQVEYRALRNGSVTSILALCRCRSRMVSAPKIIHSQASNGLCASNALLRKRSLA
jgi:hypothetical protein